MSIVETLEKVYPEAYTSRRSETRWERPIFDLLRELESWILSEVAPLQFPEVNPDKLFLIPNIRHNQDLKDMSGFVLGKYDDEPSEGFMNSYGMYSVESKMGISYPAIEKHLKILGKPVPLKGDEGQNPNIVILATFKLAQERQPGLISTRVYDNIFYNRQELWLPLRTLHNFKDLGQAHEWVAENENFYVQKVKWDKLIGKV